MPAQMMSTSSRVTRSSAKIKPSRFAHSSMHSAICAWPCCERIEVPRYDHLPRRVEIDRFDHSLAAVLLTQRNNGFILHTQHRRHAPLPVGHCVVHQPAARGDNIDRIGKGENARGDQRRILPEAVAGGGQWRVRHACTEHPVRGDVGDKHRRLCVSGDIELLRRPLLQQLPQVVAKVIAGLCKGIDHLGISRGQRGQHTERLRALPGKHNSVRFHCINRL